LYIHVDEHQDTNDAQNFIVSLIAEFFETPNIFIVGDEKQAIYRFQGASVENFLLLQKRWPSMKLISLETNYRSHQSILDASFGMIEKNYIDDEHNDLRIRLTSGSQDEPRPIDIVTGENVSSIELYLVKALKELGLSSTAAIIVRRNRDLDRVIRLLEQHNIPVSSERSIDIFNHPAGRLFFNLIEYIFDPSKIDALAKTVISGMWNLSFGDSTDIVSSLNSGKLDDLDKKLPSLAKIKKRLLEDSSVGFLIHAAEESGFTSLIAKSPSYIHVWRGIVTLAESLARESKIVDPMQLISSLLEYRTSAESRPVKISVGAPDVPIQAMTAHGSKGLEFDYVFIPYATEEAWVGKTRGASFMLPKKQTTNSDIRDIRRLFYVALTRARKHVTVLTALEESDGKIITPIRFLEELDEKHVAHATLPRAGTEEKYVYLPKASVSPLADIAKDVLMKKGLSVTALNHFLECPNKFIYQSILKMPQAPSSSAEKGTAMHAALAAVWKVELRGAKEIEAILNEKITEHFSESFLPLLEKESAKKELFESVATVSKALEPHFSVNKNSAVFTESWVESPFLNINLHGKLDAIVDSGNEVSIFDYKTKQAMSVNAIKGDTKTDSDGNYFRQLVFYKLIAGGDPRWKTRKITPALVFVSPDEKGRCPTITLPIELADIEKVKNEIQSLIDSVWSGKILEEGCQDEKCEWCGLRRI
ncbi:MAG: ATP-dependent DNA helicase, partial [bacterium]|nr:ATP-dependent DNA helicase [bacterium]